MTSPPKSIDPVLQSRQRALIELELRRLHQEATAARLDAQASRLQGMLARLDSGQAIEEHQWNDLKLGGWSEEAPNSQPPASVSSVPVAQLDSVPGPVEQPPTRPAVHRFSSWEAVRAAQLKTRAIPDIEDIKPVLAPELNNGADSIEKVPFQPKNLSDKKPNSFPIDPEPFEKDLESEAELEVAEDESTLPATAAVEIEPIDESATPPTVRRRPLPMFVSTAIHVVAVLLLATVSLTTTMPKDQMAFSASAEFAEETSMEAFSLEIAQPPSEPVESAPAETEIDLAPVGEVVAMKMTSDLIGDSTTLTDSLSSLASPSSNNSLQSIKSSAAPGKKTEFCGVEGGGNHFVYLVDSSGSMGDAFNSARSALLQSIDLLSPDQRFYVVFFDADCDFMRLSDPNTDEPRSVKASDENKRRLKSWAMRISMDKGKAPYDPLRFALGLRPDVIFLLSDGEFPQGIEDLLREENVVSNLFGESNPISIVHTIGYHSQEGETRMKRIANQNQGQYRHVPKP